MIEMIKKIVLDISYLKYPLPEKLCKELEEEVKKVNIYPSGNYDKLRMKFAKGAYHSEYIRGAIQIDKERTDDGR